MIIFKTLTVFIIILTFNIVKSNTVLSSEVKKLYVHGQLTAYDFFGGYVPIQHRDFNVQVEITIKDLILNKDIYKETFVVNQNISFSTPLTSTIDSKTKVYSLQYYYKGKGITGIKYIPEDCHRTKIIGIYYCCFFKTIDKNKEPVTDEEWDKFLIGYMNTHLSGLGNPHPNHNEPHKDPHIQIPKKQ
uniref:Uncharacterized protein n=1 Tax=Strongyloides papillosus TaxID=174720 RepID=A0A0N5CFM3_STREA